MSLWDRVSGDDLAFLALLWLALCAGAGIVYVWAMHRWQKYVDRMERERRGPDPRVFRAGSIEDFKGRLARSRWP